MPRLLQSASRDVRPAGIVKALVEERPHELRGLEPEPVELGDEPLPLARAELGRERAEPRPARRPVEPRGTPSA